MLRLALVGLLLLCLHRDQATPALITLGPPAPEVAQSDWRVVAARKSLGRALAKLTGIDLERADYIVQVAETEAAKYDLDLFRILAFIVAESWGNPQAKSWVGARGLMQIMPSTGRGIAKARDEEWRGVKSLYEIDTNISYGVWYYQHLLKIFEGNELAAIAAYNWGPRHILWRLEHGRRLPKVYPAKVLKAQKNLEREFSPEATKRFREGLRKYNPNDEGISSFPLSVKREETTGKEEEIGGP